MGYFNIASIKVKTKQKQEQEQEQKQKTETEFVCSVFVVIRLAAA